VEENTHIKVI